MTPFTHRSEIKFDEQQTVIFLKANHDLAHLRRISLHNETDDEVCYIDINHTKTRINLGALVDPNGM